MELEILKLEIAKLNLAPGDILVVRCTSDIPRHFELLRSYVSNMAGIVDNKILVVGHNVDFSVLTKKDLEAMP